MYMQGHNDTEQHANVSKQRMLLVDNDLSFTYT